MPVTDSTAVLYSQNTFDVANPTSEQMDKMIAASQLINTCGFTTVILGQWHVWEDGSIFYNDTPFDEVLNGLQVYVTALKMGGGSVQKVLITFGPGGSDFDHIAANLDAVKSCINTLRVMADIDGIDFDLESGYSQSQADTMVALVQWATGLGMIVTAAPYDNSQIDFWKGVLQQVGDDPATGFAWWNLQLYGGADYSSWESSLNGVVSNPAAFLVAGWNAAGSGPSDVGSELSQLKSQFSGIDGGFVWKYESAQETATVNAYASAIVSALDE